jgi:hypothetical protein
MLGLSNKKGPAIQLPWMAYDKLLHQLETYQAKLLLSHNIWRHHLEEVIASIMEKLVKYY